MPHRFQLFEKIAFSLVCWSAAACSAFIAYERCPDIKVVLHAGAQVLRYSGEYSFACAAPDPDICAPLPNN
ncbi:MULTISPECIES: hypothetical protein [Paraburkholderia]|jgi:hypothetical protein|uniref:Lipoprotein n=2 Tax=Paraburkholderia TaxID=1822464 RepID=A0A6J5GZW5_9BURK|nr:MULTISPECIES: hypothetical protein [Paraburkholderia]RKT27063.1 hypothetical protein B0G69_2870 [Paraburkholderia sp. RAU2J]CAB3808287.1 hypothetical protein LMG27177_06518 [Paraburkholderia fynbosensis]